MIHLHTHSMYSLRDSIIKPEDLIKRLKEIGQDTVAITDHGGSLGGVTIYKQLKEAGIKYIHGVEFYVCDDLTVKDKTSKYYHLIALCKNETGRLNMNHLISLSERPENKYYKPRIDFNLLSQYGEGLVIMSACLAGEVAKKIMADDYEGAKQTALKYKERFGDDYYLEIQAHRDDDQVRVNREVLRLAEELNIKPVVTCDAHYTYEEDKKYQNKYAFGGAYREEGESYIDCFVQSEQEVRDRLPYLDKDTQDSVINTTHEIADKCNVELPLSAPIMPKVDTPEGFCSNSEWLTTLCAEGFKSKLNIDYVNHKGFDGCEFSQDKIDEYIDRFEYEKDSLERMGFIDYILLVYSYANIAERRGIARGSGGGSLICYLTNITDIDPIEHGLYFERFIDVGALKSLESGEITAKELKIPDIDLDFSGGNCRKVLQFLYDKYGEDKVCSIGKFGTSKTRTTIRDMCKVLDIPLSEADKIAKSFGEYEISDIDGFIADEKIPQNVKEAVTNVRKYPELFDYVRKLVELPKSFGLHACGRVISVSSLDDYLPSCYDKDGIRFLQGDMHDVEDVGLVKIDLLGLRTLDQIYDTLEMSGEDKSFLNLHEMVVDPTVLNIFRNGDTLGIFQFASPGMKQTIQKMDVQCLTDLSVANALFRPGSIGYIDEYCDRKSGKKPITYTHPDLEPILKSTYGIIVFQEQLIEIGRMAGIHNPDLLRKATGKKNPALLAQVKPELEEKLKARGWTDDQFTKLWDDMLEFAKYSFNKSHASAYAMLAYITAKQKAYYPAEFYAGLLNSYIGHSDFVKNEADDIIADARRHKVYLMPFNFRDDHRRCSVRKGRIIYAIPLIRDMSESVAEVLYRHSDTKAVTFNELVRELMSDGIGASSMKVLIRLGFFSEYGNQNELLRIFEVCENFKFGEIKQMKVSKLEEDDFMRETVLKHGEVTKTKAGVLGKTVKISDPIGILNNYEVKIKSLGLKDLDLKVRASTQEEYLGFVSLTTGKESDRPKLRVKETYPLNRKSDGKQFGYSVITQSLGSGIETRFSVFNNIYNKDPVQKGDFILCKSYKKDKGYFTLTSYEHIYD